MDHTIASSDGGVDPGTGETVIGRFPPSNRPRKPWLALLLAVVCSPAAFAYVGHYAWGVAINAMVLGCALLLGWTGWVQSLIGVCGLFAVGILAQIAMLIAPWLIARRYRRIYRPRWYNRWYWYPLLIGLVVVPTLVLTMGKERYLGFTTFRVPSGSMEPTIGIGDYFVADTRPKAIAMLRAGDLVVHESDRHPGQVFVRRVVGLPGQHVLVDSDGVRVDGKLQIRTSQKGSDVLPSGAMKFADVELDMDEVYLMGDNRGNSFDSRTEGPYPLSRIRGKAMTIWYSIAPSRIGRLDREQKM